MKSNEIRIRNIDSSAIAKIDELASKKGTSRNAYLKSYIESLSILAELKDQEEKYISLVLSMAELIEENTTVLTTVKNLLQERDIV